MMMMRGCGGNVFDNTDDNIDNVLFISNGNVTWLELIIGTMISN